MAWITSVTDRQTEADRQNFIIRRPLWKGAASKILSKYNDSDSLAIGTRQHRVDTGTDSAAHVWSYCFRSVLRDADSYTRSAFR